MSAAELNGVVGKTVASVEAKPYASGLDGALERVSLRFADGTILTFIAGSYAIPEESCIYVAAVGVGGRRGGRNMSGIRPRHVWRAVRSVALFGGAVVAYMGCGVALSYPFGAGGVVAWVCGTALLAVVWALAVSEAEAELGGVSDGD